MDKPSVLEKDYKFWEITKDLIDQCIDITLNLSQSGHPGGSRSKVHGMLITLLSGAMRWWVGHLPNAWNSPGIDASPD